MIKKTKKKAVKKAQEKLPGRLLIRPCMGNVGHYRPHAFKDRTLINDKDQRGLPIAPTTRVLPKLCYYWEIMINNHPKEPVSFSGYSLLSNWNYLTEEKCVGVALKVAKTHGIDVFDVVTARKWSAKAIKADKAAELRGSALERTRRNRRTVDGKKRNNKN